MRVLGRRVFEDRHRRGGDVVSAGTTGRPPSVVRVTAAGCRHRDVVPSTGRAVRLTAAATVTRDGRRRGRRRLGSRRPVTLAPAAAAFGERAAAGRPGFVVGVPATVDQRHRGRFRAVTVGLGHAHHVRDGFLPRNRPATVRSRAFIVRQNDERFSLTDSKRLDYR